MRVRGCDRECETCPLLDLCGGIEPYGVRGYSSPFAGCRLEFPAIKRMQECGVCRHGRATWDMNEDDVRRLVIPKRGVGSGCRMDKEKARKKKKASEIDR